MLGSPESSGYPASLFPARLDQAGILQADRSNVRLPWKGTALYYDIEVSDQTNPGAAWYYPEPKEAAAQIKDHMAFWRGVQIEG